MKADSLRKRGFCFHGIFTLFRFNLEFVPKRHNEKRFRMEIKMNKMTPVTKCATTAVCMALCVVLPMAVHSVPNGGTLLSPMHLPVLLCGLICGWPYGLACGLIGPLLSSMVSGMPPMGPILYGMVIELAVYGLITGLLMQLVHTGKVIADLYISLIAAMLAGRIAGGLAKALVFSAGSYTLKAWATAYFVSSLPGILIQLLLLPVLYMALQRARLIPARYIKAK